MSRLTTLLGFGVDRVMPPVFPPPPLARMNEAVLTTTAAMGFSVAFFHAAIPTHWLPFVLVARSRQWSRAKTLAVAAFAGLGHVALTSLLGLLVAWFGFELEEHAERLFPAIAGSLLLVLGAVYFWKQWRGGVLHHHAPGGHHRASATCGHEHGHSHWDAELKDSALGAGGTSDWAAIGGLFVMLTLSPCEAFLGVYLSGVQFGWRGFFVLSAILAVATLAGMMVFTWLTLVGLDRFPLRRFERYEAALLGTIFTALGLMLLLLERGHAH